MVDLGHHFFSLFSFFFSKLNQTAREPAQNGRSKVLNKQSPIGYLTHVDSFHISFIPAADTSAPVFPSALKSAHQGFYQSHISCSFLLVFFVLSFMFCFASAELGFSREELSPAEEIDKSPLVFESDLAPPPQHYLGLSRELVFIFSTFFPYPTNPLSV